MEGVVVNVDDITIDDVNKNLLSRLNTLINDADSEEILQIAEAVAKLNASRRNNDQFAKPATQEEKSEFERTATIGEILGAK